MTPRRVSAYQEGFSQIMHEAQKLVNDLITVLESKEEKIEELESQVEELENDKLTLLNRGLDLDEVVEDA